MSSNIQNKAQIVAEIKDKFSKATSIIFVDYNGTTVAQDTSLRAEFRKDNTEYKVYKNKLVLRALEELGKADCAKYLEGTTSVAISYDSEVAPAKVLANAMKDNKNLKFKFGFLNGEMIEASYIEKLSKIPSKEVLIAQLLSMLQAPVRGLACTLKAIAEK